MSVASDIGIGMGSAVGVLIVAGLVVGVYQRYGGWTPTTTLGVTNFIQYTFGGFLFAIGSFIPFGLLMFGIISDLIYATPHNYVISAAAIFAILLSKGISALIQLKIPIDTSPVSTSNVLNSGWCTIPGLEGLESPFFPMSTLIVAMISTYYSAFAISSGYPIVTAPMVILMVIHLVATWFSGCSTSYFSIGGSFTWNIVITIVTGFILGLSTYGIIKSGYPAYAPYQAINPSAPSSRWGATAPLGGPPASATCSAEPGDDNTFVAELYKNGQLVTEKLA